MTMNDDFTKNVSLRVLGLGLLLGATACSHHPTSWHDPSHHKVIFVQVEDNVRLEVLDWGGPGQPIVLLTGSGNTAHVYDDFASKLSTTFHVYGITRRGFGASSHADFGYSDQRLADDVVQVLYSLRIVAPVLVGHSMAGAELTTIGSQHSDQLAGLVYLDAVLDHVRDDAEYAVIRKKLPEAMLRNCYQVNADGSMGDYKTAESVFNAIDAGVRKRDYSGVRVPVLAIVTLPGPAGNLMGGHYQPKNEEERVAMDESFKTVVRYIKRSEERLQSEVPGARIIEMPGADHHVFLSDETDVLRELRKFSEGLSH
jgi:pimeloyl-ACP methyl ester carboxylesterase